MGMPAPSPDNPHLSTHFRQGRAIVLHCHQDTEKGTAAAGKKPPRKEMSGTDRCRRRRGKKRGCLKISRARGGVGLGRSEAIFGGRKKGRWARATDEGGVGLVGGEGGRGESAGNATVLPSTDDEDHLRSQGDKGKWRRRGV